MRKPAMEGMSSMLIVSDVEIVGGYFLVLHERKTFKFESQYTPIYIKY